MSKPIDEAVWPILLGELARHGRRAHACRAAGVSIQVFLNRVQADELFAELVHESEEMFADDIRKEVNRRAFGVEIDVWNKDGEKIGSKTRYSDPLLETLAKSRCPEMREKISVDARVTGGVLVVPGVCGTSDEWQKKFGGVQLGVAIEKPNLKENECPTKSLSAPTSAP